MKSLAMCKNEEDHVNIISEAYSGYLNHESKNVITFTLLDKKTVMNVNVAMLRVSLLSSIQFSVMLSIPTLTFYFQILVWNVLTTLQTS